MDAEQKGTRAMDLMTLGRAAATFQQDPRVIEIAVGVAQMDRARSAGEPVPSEARPEIVLNGLRYFRTDDVVAGIKWLAESDAKRAIHGAKSNE